MSPASPTTSVRTIIFLAFGLVFTVGCSGGATGADQDGGANSADGGPVPFIDAGWSGSADSGIPRLCGPHNCGGCCDANDQCITGDSDDACGAGGASCQSCGAWGTCSDAMNICEIDPASQWRIVIESAEVEPTAHGNRAWDGGDGLPELYVVLRAFTFSQLTTRTASKPGGLSATFDESIVVSLPGSALEGVMFEVLDSDSDEPDSAGRCHAVIGLEDVDAGTRTLVCPKAPDDVPWCGLPEGSMPCQSGWTLRYRLEPVSSPRTSLTLERNALPPASGPIGDCTVREATMNGSGGSNTLTSVYDAHGRLIESDRLYTDGTQYLSTWDCGSASPGNDVCVETYDALTNGDTGVDQPWVTTDYQRTEPSSAGARIKSRVEYGSSGPLDPFFEQPWLTVYHYDSLGRAVGKVRYNGYGEERSRQRWAFAAQRRVEYGTLVGNESANGTTDFHANGHPIKFTSPLAGGGERVFDIETDSAGLPVRYTQSPPVAGESYTLMFRGAGCAKRGAIEYTNGPMRP